MTKKARFIEKLDTLSAEEKKESADFSPRNPNCENRIDWNSGCLAYQDFEKVLSLAENSSRNKKRKTKSEPRPLFEKHNCEIVRQTGDFLVVVHLDWECTVFFNFFNCGDEGALWCIGDDNNASYWSSYLKGKNIFFSGIFC
jgi:hypothetical protein